GSLLVHNSTVTGNTANNNVTPGQGGGGIAQLIGAPNMAISISSSVFTQNNNSAAPDVLSAGNIVSSFSLVSSNGGNNLPTAPTLGNLPYGTNAQLAALGYNGGLTKTRLPLTGSPLINAGQNPGIPGLPPTPPLTNDQ